MKERAGMRDLEERNVGLRASLRFRSAIAVHSLLAQLQLEILLASESNDRNDCSVR